MEEHWVSVSLPIFKEVCNRLPCPLLLTDSLQATSILFANEAFALLCGYPASLLTGGSIFSIQNQPFIIYWDTSPKAQANDMYQMVLRNAEGKLLYALVQCSKQPIQDETYYLWTLYTVNPLLEARSQASERHTLLNISEDVLEAGYIRIDFRQRKQYWSPGALRLFGFRGEHLPTSGNGWIERVAPEDRTRLGAFLWHCSRYREAGEISFSILQHNGSLRPLRLYLQPESSGAHVFRGVLYHVQSMSGLLPLEQQELRSLRKIMSQVNEAVVITNALMAITFWSKAAEAIYGWTEEEALGRHYNELIATTYGPAIPFGKFYAELMQTGYCKGELRQKNKDGHLLVMRAAFKVQSIDDGLLPDILIAATNITEFTEIEEQANKWEMTLSLTFDNIPGWIILLDRSLKIMGCNRNFFMAMKANGESELIGKSLRELPIEAAHAVQHEALALRVLNENTTMHHMIEPMLAGGQSYWLDVNRVPLRDRGGMMIGVLISAEDVTEKRAIEEQLREAEQQQERNRSLAIVQGQEEERRRVAMELHDGVGQLLTALQLQVDYLNSRKIDTEEIGIKGLTQIAALVDNAKQEIRRISYNLMPSILSDFGLGEALKNLCAIIENNSHIELDASIDIHNRRYPGQVEVGIYRIAQEVLNNAVKYSEADSIVVILEEKNRMLHLRIADNGKGFDIATISRGNGLANLTQRARLLSGTLEIESSPGTGCKVYAKIPVG